MKFFKNYKQLDLTGKWYMHFDDVNHSIKTICDINSEFPKSYTASVPGNFEIDLQSNGIIPDPYFGTNIRILEEYENKHIWYYREFNIDKLEESYNKYIVFEGLDCLTDIFINGNLIASTDNMMIPYEFKLNKILLEGSNEIIIYFKPTITEALSKPYPVLASGFHANYQSLYIRKPAHMFGWDILPRIISAGIFRSIYIEYRKPIEFQECYLQTSSINNNTCNMMFFYKCSFDKKPGDKWSIALEGVCNESSFKEEFLLSFQYGKHIFEYKNPLLWYPLGSGKQNIYDIKATLYKNGKQQAFVNFNHGIRTIKLIREPVTGNNPKGSFHFVVNGKKIFVKGTNWVAVDALHSRDKDRIPQVLEMAADINCNIIRCWGGNLYEDDLFYDLCDKLGIMIWQDFALACAVYPQDEDFKQTIETEATTTIKRLRQHPCLAIWAGDNECDQAYSWFGFDIDPNTNTITRKILPECVRNHDPFRDYLPSSPFIDSNAYGKDTSYLPENHLWGIRDYFKSDYYAKSTCRFASEMGYHGCPSPNSIAKFISPKGIWPYNNDEWLLHSTSPLPEIDTRYNFRVQLMANQIEILFGNIPDNIDDFSFASQISQAEAKKFFIELFRGDKWTRTGIIWWNLMDGWPQFSDAIVDYYFNKKLAYEYIKCSQQNILLMFKEPSNGVIELVACNDTDNNSTIDYSIIDISDNTQLYTSKAVAKSNEVTSFYKFDINNEDQRFIVIAWNISGRKYKNHYLCGIPPYDLDWYIECLKKFNNY